MNMLSRRCCASVLFLSSLVVGTGCNLSDPPEDGVQVIIEQSMSDQQEETLKENLKELIDGSYTRVSSITINGKTKLNYAPVEDVQAYADKITFAKVTKVEGRQIWIDISEQ